MNFHDPPFLFFLSFSTNTLYAHTVRGLGVSQTWGKPSQHTAGPGLVPGSFCSFSKNTTITWNFAVLKLNICQGSVCSVWFFFCVCVCVCVRALLHTCTICFLLKPFFNHYNVSSLRYLWRWRQWQTNIPKTWVKIAHWSAQSSSETFSLVLL